MELAGGIQPALARSRALAGIWRARRRAGARPGRLSASSVGDAESARADLAPLARCDAHHLRRRHRAVYGRRWKAEASLFNGREPDEDRRDVDFDPLDSFSGRVWFLPNHRSSSRCQPAACTTPRPTTIRTLTGPTTTRLGESTSIAGPCWDLPPPAGRSRLVGVHAGRLGSRRRVRAVVELRARRNALTINDRDSWFGRIDHGSKAAHDLGLQSDTELFRVTKLTAGYATSGTSTRSRC